MKTKTKNSAARVSTKKEDKERSPYTTRAPDSRNSDWTVEPNYSSKIIYLSKETDTNNSGKTNKSKYIPAGLIHVVNSNIFKIYIHSNTSRRQVVKGRGRAIPQLRDIKNQPNEFGKCNLILSIHRHHYRLHSQSGNPAMVFLRPIYWQCVINCNKLNFSKIKPIRNNTKHIDEDQTSLMHDHIIGLET